MHLRVIMNKRTSTKPKEASRMDQVRPLAGSSRGAETRLNQRKLLQR